MPPFSVEPWDRLILCGSPNYIVSGKFVCSQWRGFLARKTNLLAPHTNILILHHASLQALCALQEHPGWVEEPWRVALVGKGEESATSSRPWVFGVHSPRASAVSAMWQQPWTGIKMGLLCVLHLTQLPFLCLAWEIYVSNKLNAHAVHSSPFCIPVASSSNQKLTSPAIGKY